MNKITGIILTILLLNSCRNSGKSETENSFESENNITQSEFKKVETNNSLELEFQILDENDETLEFLSLKELAKFPGGFDSLTVFIQQNFIVPKSTDSLIIQGRIEIFFSVDTIGKVIDIELKKGLLRDIDQSCLAVISKLPDWKPAELINGEKVKMRFLLPLKFVKEE